MANSSNLGLTLRLKGTFDNLLSTAPETVKHHACASRLCFTLVRSGNSMHKSSLGLASGEEGFGCGPECFEAVDALFGFCLD